MSHGSVQVDRTFGGVSSTLLKTFARFSCHEMWFWQLMFYSSSNFMHAVWSIECPDAIILKFDTLFHCLTIGRSFGVGKFSGLMKAWSFYYSSLWSNLMYKISIEQGYIESKRCGILPLDGLENCSALSDLALAMVMVSTIWT